MILAIRSSLTPFNNKRTELFDVRGTQNGNTVRIDELIAKILIDEREQERLAVYVLLDKTAEYQEVFP